MFSTLLLYKFSLIVLNCFYRKRQTRNQVKCCKSCIGQRWDRNDDEDLMHLIVKDTIVLFLEVGEEWKPRVVESEGTVPLMIINYQL